jgi:general secretion pathway protein D
MIKEIDVKPQQIMIEVTVLSAELSETTQFGIDWSPITSSVTNSTNGISIGFADTDTTVTGGGGLHIGFTNNDRIVSLITAIEGVTDTTVLANPKIMALNKQAGYLNIGEERGYTASTTQSAGTTTTSVGFLISGTILKFRPFICDNGYVRMEINPELSSGENLTAGPLKTITQVKSNIMVKDGKTIIIGGLFKEKLTNTDSQVPIVGDLPIVGALFKSTKDENIRSELIILITPHIINDPEELAAESEKKQQDIDRIVHGSRKRMNSIARARIYEEGYAKAVDYYADKEYDNALAELNRLIEFRPNALEAVQLKEKILAETNPAKLEGQERLMLDKMDTKQDGMWKRK